MEQFELDDDVRSLLMFHYATNAGEGEDTCKTNLREIENMEGQRTIMPVDGMMVRALTLDDFNLFVEISADQVVVEVSCASVFMKAIMGDIIAAFQEKMHWVPAEKEIYLMMDKEAIREYKAQQKEKHNVVVHSQCSRSPETNALDLSIWMCLQTQTKKLLFEQ